MTVDPTPPERTRRAPRDVAGGVVGLWVLATVVAFAWFGSRDLHPLDAEAAAWFEADPVEAERWYRARVGGRGTARATVVAVTAPDCRCSRAAERHAARVAADWAGRDVRVLRASSGAGRAGVLEAPPWVVAAPAALVFDARGRLVYFGPPSAEADCGGARTGFVERALAGLLGPAAATVPAATSVPAAASGRAPQPPPATLGVGCFCRLRAA